MQFQQVIILLFRILVTNLKVTIMKYKILIPVIIFCGLVWMTSCSPDEYEVDLSYGITHGIAMHNSDEHAGTFNFYQMIHYAMIDSGVSYNRTMDAILEASVPGGAGCWS